MAKTRTKQNPFWERHVSHLPLGVKECLEVFPSSAFAPLELKHDEYSQPLLSCEIVSDLLQKWILNYDEEANERNLMTKNSLVSLLDFNRSPDPFLYSTIFFEVTCWLRVNSFSHLDMSTERGDEPETLGQDLGKFVDAYDTFWSDSMDILDKLIDWSHVGFSHRVYSKVVGEVNRLEKVMEHFKFYFPETNKVRVFKETKFELINPAPFDRKTIHRAILYNNLFRLLRAASGESDTKLYLFISCFPNTVAVSADAVKKTIQRVSKNATATQWFEQRYRKTTKIAASKFAHTFISQLAKALNT